MKASLSTYFDFLVNNKFLHRNGFLLSLKALFQRICREQNCYLCDEIHDAPTYICRACTQDLPWNGNACYQCGLPLAFPLAHPRNQPTEQGAIAPQNSFYNSKPNRKQAIFCGDCIKHPPRFDRCIAPFLYEIPVNSIIRHFKFSRQRHLGSALSQLLAQQIQMHYEIHSHNGIPDFPDIIIPVPMHRKKLKSRQFNSAEDIAEKLAQILKLPLHKQALQKTQLTHSQVGLDKSARIRNLKHSFKVCGNVAGKHIALVDDVMTTGATADTLSKILKQAGAASVDIWCLARTPKSRLLRQETPADFFSDRQTCG